MRTIVLLAAVALAAITIPVAAGSHAIPTTRTRVTIKGPNGDFQGKVKSVRKQCLANRIVSVWKQKGHKQNRSIDQRIGTDTSERHGKVGKWSLGNTGFKQGKFYAHVKRSIGCSGANSKTITLP
jgi:hypothetical protein